MKNAAWIDLRMRLHHDWMSRYIMFLMARAGYLDNVLEEGTILQENIRDQFLEWQTKEKEFALLIDDIVEALSPAQLLDEYPLNCMHAEDRTWLKDVVHALYLERTGIEATVDTLKVRLQSLADMHDFLSRMLIASDGNLKMKSGDRPFQNFYQATRNFSELISALPHNIQVI